MNWEPDVGFDPGSPGSRPGPKAVLPLKLVDNGGRGRCVDMGVRRLFETKSSSRRIDADDIQGCISQEVKPWVCCAPQGDMIYDPSWHHPPPLIPHYSKMVFETGEFDDAED
ncbi:unnamed protein product [Nyctereutes procyonoides]|uniref:(raccoon dog) hypothetical protein n=1 Tax=Nyctereutes procyonoides TaxID=34880 RepID=A0A811YDD1_NYCPR|nr:unnamed protein product [Nyctereutes procyonoides]